MVMEPSLNKEFAMDDRIFLGEGLFETLKVEEGEPLCSYLHWQRLGASARLLNIPFNLSFAEWHKSLLQQIKQDNIHQGGIKAILSGGPAPRGLAEQGARSHLVLHSFNYTILQEPIRLVSAPWRRDPANPIYQVKSVNYLEAILARREALRCNADDALFFNTHHHATETTCANLFLIKDNILYTPAVSDGLLLGITRQRIVSWSPQHFSCLEVSITHQMIEEADMLLLTNCLQGIRAVHSLDGTTFKIAHPLFEKLQVLLAAKRD